MITKIREYIKNHPRFALILCGVIFIAAIFIFLQYLYLSFTPPPPAEGEVVTTSQSNTILSWSIVSLIFILIVGGIVGLFWWIYKKTKEEYFT